jgi:hypothetical protein
VRTFAPNSRGADLTDSAEIIPVEPEQGNACEGKVIIPLLLSFLFLLLTFKPVT